MADIANITPLKAFTDNYIWVWQHDSAAIVVDPGEATVVQAFLRQHDLTLHGIWITHHHHDHTGGIAALRHEWPNCPVYGPASVPEVSHPVMEGSQLQAPGGLSCSVYETPGHTANHLSYHCGQHVFCGDTLFSAGCGRVFDSTASQLYTTLQRLAALQDDTLLYPAHEYTLSNLQFALAVEPGNPTIADKIHDVKICRAAALPTLPCRLEQERQYNPFLRSHHPEIRKNTIAYAPDTEPSETGIFTALREWKNHFRTS